MRGLVLLALAAVGVRAASLRSQRAEEVNVASPEGQQFDDSDADASEILDNGQPQEALTREDMMASNPPSAQTVQAAVPQLSAVQGQVQQSSMVAAKAAALQQAQQQALEQQLIMQQQLQQQRQQQAAMQQEEALRQQQLVQQQQMQAQQQHASPVASLASTGTLVRYASKSGQPTGVTRPKGWDQCLKFARYIKAQDVTGVELIRVWKSTCEPAVQSGHATERYRLMCNSLGGAVEPYASQLDYNVEQLCDSVLAVFHDVTAVDAKAR